jgi:hypothetical protein
MTNNAHRCSACDMTNNAHRCSAAPV